MNAKDVIEARFKHRPHPGLCIKVTLSIGKAPPKFSQPFHLIVPVPARVPFDSVEEWWDGTESPAGIELWDMMQQQLPKFSKNLERYGLVRNWRYAIMRNGKRIKLKGRSPNLQLEEPYVVAYVHRNGKPYDIRPFMRDRVSGLLGESRPHPGLCVQIDIDVYRYDATSTVHEPKVMTIVVPVPDGVPFDDIQYWLRQKERPGSFVTWWPYIEAQHHIDKNTVSAIVYPGGIAGYVHADGTPYDVRPFFGDRVKGILDK